MKLKFIILILIITINISSRTKIYGDEFLGINYDKLLHFSAGYIMFTSSSWFENKWQVEKDGKTVKFDVDKYRLFSWGSVILVASIKETVDPVWDWDDWLDTILGGGIGSIIVYSW